MKGMNLVAIEKMDVLMEDYSKIVGLIHSVAGDMDRLIEARNTWEVFFAEYNEDPREIPMIPEVVNWIKQSLAAGIPWFYFMRTAPNSMGLRTFMVTCCGDPDPEDDTRYLFDKNRVMEFVNKNMENLESFTEEYGIPEAVSLAAAEDIMAVVMEMLSGTFDAEPSEEAKDRDKMMGEALYRLSELEKLYGLNPKVREYFSDGRLYYSYLTGGGYMGSIDTINYDKRYAEIVRKFEEETSFLVYHVIEHEDTVSLLFVSDDYSQWQEERPSSTGVLAQVVNVERYENKCGFIKLDVIQGALRRRDNRVYPNLKDGVQNEMELSDVGCEMVERLEILENAGMMTDLDVVKIYMREHEMCYSELLSVLGMETCVVDRLSADSEYEYYAKCVSEQLDQQIYFLMVARDGTLAFLYISDDPEEWEMEKLDLAEYRPKAIVVDTDEMTASIERIRYSMVNGGPLCNL